MADESWQNYKDAIRSIIKKLTGSYNEDLEQEACLKIWQNREKYAEQGKSQSWVRAVTSNLVRDYFRSKFFRDGQSLHGGIEKISVRPKLENRIDAKRKQKIILNAVDSLPLKLRKVIILYEFEDMSYDQIAEKINVPVGTVKSRLTAARKELSVKLNFLKGDNYE